MIGIGTSDDRHVVSCAQCGKWLDADIKHYPPHKMMLSEIRVQACGHCSTSNNTNAIDINTQRRAVQQVALYIVALQSARKDGLLLPSAITALEHAKCLIQALR